ncbi:carbohydrate binding family 9 domain-containing protein [Catenovulum sp. SM1970]|uniref:carbohydrate binding family 9 domain-containing protein n=1 Tax=Marinifaba aquimaris TaxID=2741323 RepID=UPI0015743495|nr:carbohydrate binding family 9 domain-containing protein [Marinifaba aquimaris]NTS77029.1 carbohydrate binding family 9 domain-containing protein [Marinifaba aquimaris]
MFCRHLFKLIKVRFVQLFFILFLPIYQQAANAKADQTLAISTYTDVVQLDGVLDEPVWQKANELNLNYVTQPFENTSAPVATQVYYYQTTDRLFVAFDAKDPNPQTIRAFYRPRDKAWDDDLVGVKLDTFGDAKLAYQFFVNPYGVQLDAIEDETNGSESDSWDAIWSVQTKVHDFGYTVEMAIPLSIMNMPPVSNKEHQFGIEFVRFYPREVSYRLSHIKDDRNNSCTLCQMAPLTGIQASASQNLTLVPSLVVSETSERDLDETRDWSIQNDAEVGLDINYALSANTQLTGTLNPDFSQIEADSAELSINDTFTLFLDEKRRFFLENNDYFSTNFDLVYSRNIADPDAGIKLTSRVDDHTLALMVTNDTQTQILLPGNTESDVETLDESSINAAFRYRYDVTDALTIGTISTLRESDNYHNYMLGVDTRYRFNDQTKIAIQALWSDSLNPFCLTDTCQASTFSDTAYRIDLEHNSRDWEFYAIHQNLGEDFRADLGFEEQVDITKSIIGSKRFWYPTENWWNEVEVWSDWDIAHNINGELIEKELEGGVRLNGQQQSFISMGTGVRDRVGPRFNENDLSIDGNTQLYNEDFTWLWAEMRPVANLWVGHLFEFGNQIDFANDRLAEFYELKPELDWDMTEYLNLELVHVHKKLEADNADVFTANLTDLRLNYQFDVRHRLKIAAIYSNFRFNPDNYQFEKPSKERSLSTQLIYSYTVNPGTVVYLGYADGAYDNPDDGIDGLTKNQKSMFAKLSYAWQI